MKRLYIILMSMAVLLMGVTFATDFDVSVTPNTQNAISGTVVGFDISVSNNTGVDAYVVQELPFWAEYYNSNIVPENNPALALGLETNPKWILSSGQSLNIHADALVQARSFSTQDIVFNIADMANTSNVYTSAVAQLEPISDVVVTKTLVGNQPQLTGDTVTYDIEVKNIGSKTATGISLVDVWPNNDLTFPNQAVVAGSPQVPTIYNGLANNYKFLINDLAPFATSIVEIVGSMDVMLPVGYSIENTAFAIVGSDQYNTENDTDTLNTAVKGFADVDVSVVQTSPDPILSGDRVGYLISYANIGSEEAIDVLLESTLSGNIEFLSAIPAPLNQTATHAVWDLFTLSSGQSGNIVMTGIFLGNSLTGNLLSNVAHIETNSVEFNGTNNSSIATGQMQELSDMSVVLFANNLTDATRNYDTGIQIFAISGDIVELEIVVNNDGNMLETGVVSISNINGFVNYVGITSWNINLVAGDSQVINLTGIVGPQNYISFTPVANLSYDSLLETDDVEIQEPLECGDGLITQGELCDINGQIGDMLPGQYCEEQGGQCVIVTEDIINTVCMEYTTDIGTGEQCMNVIVAYEEQALQAQCRHLSAPYSVVIVDEDNEGDMPFTCETVDDIVADEITIDCGNGDVGTAYATSSFTYDCDYEYDENGNEDDNIYDIECVVDNHTCEECHGSTRVDQGFYGVCGDGTIDDGEECDLGGDEDEEIDIDRYLDEDRDYRAGRYEDAGYYCEDCRIRENDDTFVYQTPQCLVTNTTISVMDNELIPFRWRLWDRDNMKFKSDYDCDDIDNDETKTIIDKDSMECTFAIYNGVDYQQENDEELNKFTVNCFQEDDSVFFEYFEEEYNVDFDKVSGKYVGSVNSLFDGTVDTYGEYKLVLEKIEYEYCSPDSQEWEEGRLYEGVCEVNFALTRPYMMQISTFGIDPIATDASDFLKDFYDINGNSLVKSADIDETLDVDTRDYGFDSDTIQQMSGFKSRYESLSIAVDNNFEIRDGKTIGDLFNNAEVKKVPNRLIFFVKGNGELRLKQLTQYFPGIPFTIYVEGMDVVVEGSVKTNGMIITDQKIYFEDSSDDVYCEFGGQVVQGIFVAQGGFDAADKMMNQSDQQRCQRGNLQVKGVLIGDGIENLMDNRRSHLNSRFQLDSTLDSAIKRERRQKIFEGAALLIEYNPELWNALPPGAESFTQSLDVYRN